MGAIEMNEERLDTTRSLRDARRAFERHYIVAVLEQHDWRVAEAARTLGLQRPNLYRKARQLQIELRRQASRPWRTSASS